VTLVTPPSGSSTVTLDSAGFDGSTGIELIDTSAASLLTVGDSFTLTFDVEIDPREVSDPLENQVTGAGGAVDANGNPILDSTGNPIGANDLSDSGAVADDQGTNDDPTLFDPPQVPTGEISGSVFADSNNNGIQEPGEAGIAGVEITLVGVDVFGNPVEQTVFTDAQGNYSFTGLAAGSYQVFETQPEGFEDGIDIGADGVTVGADQFSNIQLGFGESFAGNTFAEQAQLSSGASGNPPTLTGLPRITASRISSLLSSFAGSPGPIYSGIPVNSNANPLSLDSGRAVTGGYTGDGAGSIMEDNICCEPVEPCCEEVITAPVEQIMVEDCGCEPAISEVPMEVTEACCEPELPQEEVVPCEEVCDPCCDSRPSLMKRIFNWLSFPRLR